MSVKSSRTIIAALLAGAGLAIPAASSAETLPNMQTITPTAARGSVFVPLNPHLAANPGFTAGQAISTVVSPDGKTLLVLTSGFNRVNDSTGTQIPSQSNEYVFVYDVSNGAPVEKQVLQLPNTFVGIAFAADSRSFFVSGGVDDNVHVFALGSSGWVENGSPIALGHGTAGNGLFSNIPGFGSSVNPEAAGLALTADGSKLVVADYENDSISVVDVHAATKTGELDLRPGKSDTTQAGVPGGEFPYGVAVKGDSIAYVSSVRDRQIVVVDISGTPKVVARVRVQGNPNKMILNRAQTRLLVATDNADTIDVIDTRSNQIVHRIKTTAPPGLIPGRTPVGATPNSLTLSPDERTLYVTNAGMNAVAVIELDDEYRGQVAGLIPTAWYPNAVSLSADGRHLYVANGKSNAGPSPGNCSNASASNTSAPACPPSLQNGSANQYVWQLTKGGLLSLPVPGVFELQRLTQVVAANDGLVRSEDAAQAALMDALHDRIKHVIYIVKENRTYDEILGDSRGNGDPSIAQFPRAITPNFHAIADQFVNLDAFYCSGEVSMDGWQWSTGARTADLNDKTTPVNYAGRGLSYDSEGTSRDVNMAFGTSAERQQHDPNNPLDPDLLPGTRNDVDLDGPDGEEGAGYIWNAALRAGKSVRNYGFIIDLTLYSAPASLGGIALVRDPFTAGLTVATPAMADLLPLTDPYFRGFDPAFPDFWRFKEWAREFDGYVSSNSLPAFETVRLMEDHTGSFSTAIDGVNTPELQQADNDYAVGLLVDKVAHSPYASDTLIFVLEDDSQDGPDHVDAHRSTGYVVGPYVRHGAVVSTRYATVNMLRTIEDVLDLEHLTLHDGGVAPMTDVFDLRQRSWTYKAEPSDMLRTSTQLPLPPKPAGTAAATLRPRHDAAWWAAQTLGFDFRKEDLVDAQRYNRILWKGLMGDRPYPTKRKGTKG
jgi:DNA-binding beta-propeller fold protein YncE